MVEVPTPALIRTLECFFLSFPLDDGVMVLESVTYTMATVCTSAPEEDHSIWWKVDDIVINSSHCTVVFLIIQCTDGRKTSKGCNMTAAKPNSTRGVVCHSLVDGCSVNRIQAVLADLFVSRTGKNTLGQAPQQPLHLDHFQSFVPTFA
jgi:hypothetical protein